MKQRVSKADSEQVSQALPDGAVLVEFARTQAMLNQSKDMPKHSYVAFVLHAGKGDAVSLVDLGDAHRIDSLIAEYKSELTQNDGGSGDAVSAKSRELYDRVFRPLQEELGAATDIFISPDGNLNLIPFEVLQNQDGRFLIEDYTINYLAAGREVIGFTDDLSIFSKQSAHGCPGF